jgi:hypothetical protein
MNIGWEELNPEVPEGLEFAAQDRIIFHFIFPVLKSI